MKKSRFSEEQMVKILCEADRMPIAEVASLANTLTCYETTFDISGGSCDIVSGRTFLVNGVAETCDDQPWPSLPRKELLGAQVVRI